jgi:hypothetical protein
MNLKCEPPYFIAVLSCSVQTTWQLRIAVKSQNNGSSSETSTHFDFKHMYRIY